MKDLRPDTLATEPLLLTPTAITEFIKLKI